MQAYEITQWDQCVAFSRLSNFKISFKYVPTAKLSCYLILTMRFRSHFDYNRGCHPMRKYFYYKISPLGFSYFSLRFCPVLWSTFFIKTDIGFPSILLRFEDNFNSRIKIVNLVFTYWRLYANGINWDFSCILLKLFV